MLDKEKFLNTAEELPSQEVEKIFTDLDLGIDFRNEYPELFERLIEMHTEEGSHFYDAIEMAKIIDKNWGNLNLKSLDKRKMLLSTLLHDIGKSGPEQASSEARDICRWLFRKSYTLKDVPVGTDVRKLSVKEFIDRSEYPDKDGAKKLLVQELDIDIERCTMIEFWRKHVDWTYDILSNHMDENIDTEVVLVTASHHILDGKNPANINIEDVPDGSQWIGLIEEYQILTLVDKYQAFRERSHLSHQEAVEALQKMVTDSNLSEKVKADYLQIISKFSDREFINNLELARQETRDNYHS